MGVIPREGYPSGVEGTAARGHERAEESQRQTLVEVGLERPATEGESPVDENALLSSGRFPSKAGHVEARSNPGGPSPQAKYSSQPDAALARIVGENPIPRTELTKKLWEYIKKNNLQQKKFIKADEALEAVFNGKKEVDMFELTRLVNSHIVK
jgi:chromatin remodeling complex protein RSC6